MQFDAVIYITLPSAVVITVQYCAPSGVLVEISVPLVVERDVIPLSTIGVPVVLFLAEPVTSGLEVVPVRRGMVDGVGCSGKGWAADEEARRMIAVAETG